MRACEFGRKTALVSVSVDGTSAIRTPLIPAMAGIDVALESVSQPAGSVGVSILFVRPDTRMHKVICVSQRVSLDVEVADVVR